MHAHEIVCGILLDDAALTLDELARACSVEPAWLAARVEAGLIGAGGPDASAWRFTDADMVRARRLAHTERVFELDPDAAAFMVDLIEEIERLRMAVRRAGLAGAAGAR